MKKIKCYGKKKLRQVETSTHKAFFNEKNCEINNSKSISYNLRLRKRVQNEKNLQTKDFAEGKEISKSSIFNSFSFVSNLYPPNIEPKKKVYKKPLKSKINTSYNKKMQVHFLLSEENRVSRGSELRGSLFRTSRGNLLRTSASTGYENRLSAFRTKRNLRARPIQSIKRKTLVIKTKKGKGSLTKKECKITFNLKKTSLKSGKGKKKKKSIVKSRKSCKRSSYIEKLNDDFLKLDKYKLVVEHQSKKKKVEVKKDKKNSALDLENLNIMDKKNITAAKNLTSIPSLLDNTVHKKDKYGFHKESHTTSFKCSRNMKVNKNLSRSNLSRTNAEEGNVESLYQNFDSGDVLRKKEISCMQQNAQSSFFQEKPRREPRVNVSRLSLSTLEHYKVNLSLLNVEESDKIPLKSQDKLKNLRKGKKVLLKKAKTTDQKKIEDKQKIEDVATLESTKKPKKELKITKVNIPDIVTETNQNILPSSAKSKNIKKKGRKKKKITQKKAKITNQQKIKDQQEVEAVSTLVSTKEPKENLLKSSVVAEQYSQVQPSEKTLCLNLTKLDLSKLDLKEFKITKVNIPEFIVAEKSQNILPSPAKSKNIKRKGRKRKKNIQKKAKITDKQKMKDQQEVEDVTTLVVAKEPKKSLLKPTEVPEQYSPAEPSKKKFCLNITKLDLSKLDLKKYKITKVNIPELNVAGTDQNISQNPTKLTNIRKKGKKLKKITQKRAKNTDQLKIKQKVEDVVATLESKECQKDISKPTERAEHYSPLTEDQVNLARLSQSKQLVSSKVDLSLSTTCVSKSEKGKENKKIVKKTGKKQKSMKGIMNKKKKISTQSSIKAPLKKNTTKLHISKQANKEVIQLIKQKNIDKNEEVGNNVSTTSSSSINAKKQEFNIAELNVPDQIVEESHVYPSLNEIDDSDAILENNENSLLIETNFSTPKTLVRTKHVAKLNISTIKADEKLTMKGKKEKDINRKNINLRDHLPLAVKRTPLMHKKMISLKDPPLPVTSTPVSHKKKLLFPMQLFEASPEQEKSTNISNISGIFSSNVSKTKKREYHFEGSLIDEVEMNNISPRKVRSLGTRTKRIVNKVRDRNIPHESNLFNQSQKSYSNIESIFLKSQTCLKLASRDLKNNLNLKPLFDFCKQNAPLHFEDIYKWKTIKIEKVGEGSYGEVFLLKNKGLKVIIKVIPISRDPTDNLQSAESVYSEIRVCSCLNSLRDGSENKTKNFNLLREVWIVQDIFPEILMKAWDVFKAKKPSYNCRPDTYDNKQIYAVLELEYGGQELCEFKLKNGLEAESILKQIAITLSIAEETNLFEHRDLHVSNVLVQRTKNKKISYILRGSLISIPSNGVIVNIIDFTLSRILEYGIIFYHDLAEEKDMFEQEGDNQFDVYRATRTQLKNNWQECLLFTNILWIKHICLKLLTAAYTHPTSVMHKRSIENLKYIDKMLLQCKRALDMVIKCDIADVPAELNPKLIQLNAIAKYVDKRSLMK